MNVSLDNHVVLLVGERGCGKHTTIERFCKNNYLESVDISDEVTDEFISDLYLRTTPTVYIIDINRMAEKVRYINKENALLKFIEEPPMGCYIYILAEYMSQVIDTISNRCVVKKFQPYSVSTLRNVKQLSDDRLYTLLNTPGKLLSCESEEYYLKRFSLCDSIIHNIHRANVSNTLSLDRHLEEYSVQDILKVIKLHLHDECVSNGTSYYSCAYDVVSKYLERSLVLNINEKNLFDSFLLELKMVSGDGQPQ